MKKVSMEDVGRRAGVSRNTVSLALRSDPQIPGKTRDRIRKIADEMGYKRNPLIGEIMASMRSRGKRRSVQTLALVNAHPDRYAFRRHPTIPTYVEGCRRRAAELGFTLDPVWMHEPGMSGQRFCSIFRARTIRGILIIGMMEENRIPENFLPVIKEYPSVVTGVRTRDPGLSFASVDHHMLALKAFEKAIELGYDRPGLVLDDEMDQLVEGRFGAGYRTGQLKVPVRDRLSPFFNVKGARQDLSLFRKWLEAERPDALFCLYHEVEDWLSRLGIRIPNEMALIQYEWRPKHANWAGMNQHNDRCGEAAIDMLAGKIHTGELGPPTYPLATLVGPSWVDGSTAPGKR